MDDAEASELRRRLREAEARLAATEASAQALLDAIPGPTVGYDPATMRIVLANEAMVQQYGFTRDELLSMSIAELRPEAELPRLKAELERSPPPLRAGIWKHRRKDGSLLDADVSTQEVVLGGRKLRISTAIDVTEQLAVSRKLAEQHLRLRAVLANAPIVIFAIDANGVFTFSEGLGLAAAGLRPGQLVGAHARDVYGETSFTGATGALESGAQVLERVLGGVEYSGFSTVGETIYANRLHPMRDEAGRVIGVIGVATDVTSSRKAEARAREREERYRELFEHTSDGVFLIDVAEDGRFRLAGFNPAEERLVGIPSAAVEGKFVDEVLPPEIAKTVSANYRRCVEAGEAVSYNEELDVPAGRRLFATTLVPLKDERGVCRRIIGVARNVTEQVAAEAALRESERRFRALIENSTDGTLLCSASGEILFRSASLRRILGYPEETKLEPIRDYVHPDDRASFEPRWQEVLEKPGVAITIAARVRHFDGSWRMLEGVCVNLLADPALRGVVMNFRDVTERKQMEAQLMAADRMVSIGTLAAGTAHEINNPLAYLIANLTLAAETLPVDGDPRTREALAAAQQGAERIRRIVGGLKTFSRADEAKLGPVDVNPVLDATANLASNEILHRGRLERDYARDLPRARANDSQLGQVVLNLLVNAAQAMPEGEGREKVITLSSRASGGRVIVEVRDTGTGISREHVPRLFDPFFTTKPIGVGTGLGLYICRQLLAAMGGTIAVESEPGRGSTFRISLQMAPEAEPEAPAKPADAVPPASAQPRGRILAVDDEPMISRVLQLALKAHEVTAVSSATAALELLRAGKRFDLILCDLMMPGMTGMDLHATLVRELAEQARRMVFLTGGAFTPRAREFLDAVDAPRVEKPFEVRAMRTLVSELLARLGPA